MYAYNYGIQNFNKKYQPLHNVVVFNDEIIIEDDSEKDPESQIIDESAVLENPEYTPAPEEYAYFEVEKLGQYENRFKSIKESRIMNKRLAEDYLIPNKYMKNLGADNILDERHSPRFQVYEYQGRYIAKTVTVEFLKFLYPGYTTEYALNLYREYSLEEVEVTAKSRKNKDKTINKVKKNIFQLSGSFLEALKNNPDISVIFFFSNDGAKIENTHLDINKIRDNEIVFFLEKDDSYNIFGTVARVLTGANIKSSSVFPSKAIARLAKVLGVDVDQDRIEEIAVEHIDYKNRKEERGILYYLGKAAEIISSAGAWLLKVSFGDGLVFIGDTISGLKFGEHRWKYYDKEGNPDPKFSPIFPGLKSALDYLENSEKKKEEKGPTFQDTKAKIQQKYEDFLEIIPNDRLRKYLTEKLQFIPDFLAELDRWYQKFLSYLKSTVKTTLIYLNALFIGIVNSLIEALGGILRLVGTVLSLPYYLNRTGKSENKSSNSSFVFELLENGIKEFAKLFSRTNLNATFRFTIQRVGLLQTKRTNPYSVVTEFQQADLFVKMHMDNVLVHLFDNIKKTNLKKSTETLLESLKKLNPTAEHLAKKKFEKIFSPVFQNRINNANRVFGGNGDVEPLNRNRDINTTNNAHANGRFVYLTFDDGLQPGTQEVLSILKKHRVKGTFFLTGIHVKDFIENHDRALGLKLLKEIYNNHYIGNHSYSHANLFYKNYYSKGLKIGKNDNEFIYRTVLEDFMENDKLINKYLKEAGIKIADDWQWQVARFPGRNTWYRTGYKDAVSDTLDEAKELFAKKYFLYGWDVEWNMDFEIVELQKKVIQDRVDNNTMDWTNEAHTHPDYDLYDPMYIDKDRINEKWSDVVEDIDDHSTRNYLEWPFDSESVKLGHVVVLMHERAFRHGRMNSKTHSNKLSYLISKLKKRGFTFATMFDYATK